MSQHFIVVTPDDNLLQESVTVFHDKDDAMRLIYDFGQWPCDCSYCTSFGAARLYVVEMPCLMAVKYTVTEVTRKGSSAYPVEFTSSLSWDGLIIPQCNNN